jgi:putative methyltransferase (TIGR04325 family)
MTPRLRKMAGKIKRRLAATFRRRPGLEFRGNYATWAAAQNASTGYDSATILEKCKNALLKVKNGEVAYERDSVVFNKIEYSWPVLSALLRAGVENNGKLSVLDFGGSLGSSYFQNRGFLNGIKSLQWGIVEQPNFVQCGRQYFADQKLKFFSSVEQCARSMKPNVLLVSSTLPYLESPHEMIRFWKTFNFKYIIIDRTYFIDGEKDRLTVQTVPEAIYPAAYPAWFFAESRFLRNFGPEYELVADFDSYLNASQYLKDQPAKEKGFIFRRKRPK